LQGGYLVKMNIVFDSSSIISIVLNNLIPVLEDMKRNHNVNFYLPLAVQRELVTVPIQGRRFKLEAMELQKKIDEGLFIIYSKKDYLGRSMKLYRISNQIFNTEGKYMRIIQEGEIQSLVLADELDGICVVDERTLRMLVEDPQKLKELLSSKLHTTIKINTQNLKIFRNDLDVDIIRSSELMTVAFEKGLVQKYATGKGLNLLDALLWGLRLRGCAISTEEIEEIKSLENKQGKV